MKIKVLQTCPIGSRISLSEGGEIKIYFPSDLCPPIGFAAETLNSGRFAEDLEGNGEWRMAPAVVKKKNKRVRI